MINDEFTAFSFKLLIDWNNIKFQSFQTFLPIMALEGDVIVGPDGLESNFDSQAYLWVHTCKFMT